MTKRLALLGCGWVADMHARAAAACGHAVVGVANHRLESADCFAVGLFSAQLREALGQIAAWQPGTPSPAHGLIALRICEQAYASAAIPSGHAG